MSSLPYHDDRDHLRRELLENSTTYFTAPGQKELTPNHALRITSVLGSSYAYNLAAAIQWVAKNVGETEADGLAAWLSDSLTNGDGDGLNEDLTPTPYPPAPTIPPGHTRPGGEEKTVTQYLDHAAIAQKLLDQQGEINDLRAKLADTTVTVLATADPTLTSLLGHLPRGIRDLIEAADAIRNEWATATDPQRQDLWNRISDASEIAKQIRPDGLGRVLAEVAAERDNQDARWGVEDTSDFERISILTEEVGEAAKAANEANFRTSPTRGDRRSMRAELVQVAATAIGHIQQVDRTAIPTEEPS